MTQLKIVSNHSRLEKGYNRTNASCFRALGKEKVYFQAPDSNSIEKEMKKFLDWFNTDIDIDLVIKAAVAHLWFVTIHPFEDGDGTITRALTDMLLVKADKSNQRYYNMSA